VHNQEPIVNVIKARRSCRTYLDKPLSDADRKLLEGTLSALGKGPLGTAARFKLIAATPDDEDALKGLGTYGVIKGATGFIAGAVASGDKNFEDFGFLMERAIVFATGLGLGTCWLGGTFTRSTFAERLDLRKGEVMPAVVSVGYPAGRARLLDRAMRLGAGSDRRFPWERLFFDASFGTPLTAEAAGPYRVPLEMMRLAPSASNKQPWRVVKDGTAWHFWLQRTRGYGGRLLAVDLQRVDLGIGMSHFELSASELGLAGRWVLMDPGLPRPDDLTEYTVTWIEG